ncbi:MAG: Hsp20/alpha crystallin family protein [Desulfobacteraceae bacterium]|nr:Hsp20/alpha crystallin family protein [Desulfobacteraceae bacterium]
MNRIKIQFGDEFNRIGFDLERTIQSIFRPRPVNPMFACRDCNWIPQMDIFETEKEVFIWAELAGVEKKDLGVEVNSKAVRIYGYRKEMPKPTEGAYRLAEIRYGKFERVLYLPSPVDTEVISTTFADGFLAMRMLKLELHKTHKVPISDE